jgi:hypothetical protein
MEENIHYKGRCEKYPSQMWRNASKNKIASGKRRTVNQRGAMPQTNIYKRI